MSRRPARQEVAVPAPRPVAGGLAAAVADLELARERLGEVIAMLDRPSACEDVVTTLTEVTRSVHRAGFAVIASGMRECVVHPRPAASDLAGLERLFLTLA